MKAAYRVIAHIIALGVVAQASFIALGWFTTLHDIDKNHLVVDKAYIDGDNANIGHVLHGIVGMNVMPLLGLALLIVSFFAKIPGGVKWAGFTLLAVVVQVALALISFGAPAVGALHGINAIVLFTVALITGRRVTTAAPAAVPAPEAATV
ncbi:MAG TPA: hypothetical protein VLW53_14945 [Candidatus Eisenbacteria bacterium]|nr:hypothetical protein [Candidatus Eisenbacteria bacterium]